MSKHRSLEPPRRPARAGSSLRTVQNILLAVALLVGVGVIVAVAPGGDDERPVSAGSDPSRTPSAAASDDGSLSSLTRRNGEQGTLARRSKELVFRAGIVPGTTFKKVKAPVVPKSFRRVPAAALETTSFQVSSFNVLGAGHTVPGGNKKGWASGVTRMAWATSLVRTHGVDVIGFQEFQAPQFNTFQRLAGGEFGVYPGLSQGVSPVQNSIAWRLSDWELVSASTTPIPYFDGHRVPMPHVLLRNRLTGREVWFMNYHNPADAHGPAQGARNLAVSIEISLINRLRADGTPVVITGDMNDREEFMCRVASSTGMTSANGGYYSGGCHMPPSPDVDWVMGTDDFTFSDFIDDRGPLVSRTTDHPMIRATATLPAQYDAKRCVRHPEHRARVYCPPSARISGA